MESKTSIYKGSKQTKDHVQEEIRSRYGDEAASAYDPKKNCFTLHGWQERGYKVKRGEHGILSYTVVGRREVTEDDNGQEIIKESGGYKKKIYLFYVNQVEKVFNFG